jgi:glyoxalase family protein
VLKMKSIQGLHHITAVCGNPQHNIDFYQNVLGQRFVKQTVNFDDPGTYHFYFGDKIGTPGTILTFFPWQHMRKGLRGNGETAAFAYTIPSDSVVYWQERLAALEVRVGETQTRFGATVIPFQDPDGMVVELITQDAKSIIQPWEMGPVPAVHMLRGFHSVTLWLHEVDKTAQLLTDQLGYQFVGQEGKRTRYKAASDEMGIYVDILHRPGEENGRFGLGSIHHIAFRTVDDAEHLEYQHHLRAAGQQVTPVQDRNYFHSIYFRSPSGVLFEVATDAPGFTVDEPVAELGSSLKLPTQFEPHRAEIERVLPPIKTNLVNGGKR